MIAFFRPKTKEVVMAYQVALGIEDNQIDHARTSHSS